MGEGLDCARRVRVSISSSVSDSNGADAPSPTGDLPTSEGENPEGGSLPTPSTFQEWHQAVKDSRNRPATLRWMIEVLYPGLDPPDYGYIGKIAKQVGGAGRLADLLWQHSTRPPTGDVLAYLLKVAKGGNHGNGQRKTTGEPPPVINGWTECPIPAGSDP